jgi:hypothetical protein
MPNGDSAATAGPAQRRFVPPPADESTYHVDPGRGWLLFAGIMLGVVGLLNVVYGIAAVGDSRFYVRGVTYIFGDLNTWGWILTVIGALQLAAAFVIWRQTEWGRWLGITLAGINAIVQMLMIPAHPLWSVMVFAVDIIVNFGLATFGGRDRYSLDA